MVLIVLQYSHIINEHLLVEELNDVRQIMMEINLFDRMKLAFALLSLTQQSETSDAWKIQGQDSPKTHLPESTQLL